MHGIKRNKISTKTIFGIILIAPLLANITQVSGVTSAAFNCVSVPHITPPPIPKDAPKVKSTLKPVCPTGQVPQPIANPNYRNKGLPPGGSSLIDVTFRYVYAYQYVVGHGLSGSFTQHQPYLAPTDYHTLAESAAQAADQGQIVEVGWTVDRGLNGDSNPHLFVFSWVNRIPNCYNGCGYIQYSNTIRPGMTVTADGSSHYQAIQYWYGNWWINYDGQWIGYFPESIWNSKGVIFKQVGLVQWFGEVALNAGVRTQMGNGTFGSNAGSATVTNTSIITNTGKAAQQKTAAWSLGQTNPACYTYGMISPGNAFRYGGPGC